MVKERVKVIGERGIVTELTRPFS